MRTDLAVFSILQHALDAANLRQAVYANNLANAETPGYRREDVSFEQMLQPWVSEWLNGTAASGGSAGGLLPDVLARAATVVPQVVLDNAATTIDNSGNNVDIDAEMASLAENEVRYNALVQDVQMRLARWRTAIGGQ